MARRRPRHAWAQRPLEHDAIATALDASVQAGFFGTVDAAEGLDLLSRLQIDDTRRAEVRRRLTHPIEAYVDGVVALKHPSEQAADHAVRLAFSRWPPAAARAPYCGIPSWFIGAQLRRRGCAYARVVRARWSQSFENPHIEASRIRSQRLDLQSLAPSGPYHEWHLLRATPALDLLELVGTAVEFHPSSTVSYAWRRLGDDTVPGGHSPAAPSPRPQPRTREGDEP